MFTNCTGQHVSFTQTRTVQKALLPAVVSISASCTLQGYIVSHDCKLHSPASSFVHTATIKRAQWASLSVPNHDRVVRKHVASSLGVNFGWL